MEDKGDIHAHVCVCLLNDLINNSASVFNSFIHLILCYST